MFALVNDKELILGPIQFNSRLINATLEEELEIDYKLSPSDYLNVPITITDKVKVLKVLEEKPPYNSRYETVTLYNYEILEDQVIFYYQKNSKDLSIIKQDYKNIISSERWNRENLGYINFVLNENEIQISTSRENRISLVTKLSSGDGPYNYKFGSNWFEITSNIIRNIISKIDEKVQTDFNWELEKIQEIDNCTSIEELEKIDFFDVNLRIQDPTKSYEI